MDDLIDSWSSTKPVSEQIAERLKKDSATFRCNDNIAKYIKEGELDLLQKELEEKIQGMLETLVIDTVNDHNTKETARRVAKMMLRETFGGRYAPMPKVTSFPKYGLQEYVHIRSNICSFNLCSPLPKHCG